ncbi:MAG: hypothetical protein ACFFG0_13630 [Candidatus Thorarchaeota archaeon]
MRKIRIVCISILFALFLIPFVNTSTATPPGYIGVQVGEEYSWKIHINLNNLQTLLGDMNSTIPPELTMFESIPDTTIKAKIEWISDEISGSVSNYTLVNISLTASVPGYGQVSINSPGEYFTVYVLNNNTLTYFNDTIVAIDSETFPSIYETIFPILIVPLNLNWTHEVETMQSFYSIFPEMPNVTTEVYRNGFHITIPSQTLDVFTLQELEIFATWDEKGVFNTAKFTYGGGTILSVNIGGEKEIPGYEPLIIIGITTVACIGVILAIKKKNRFKV